MLILENLEGIQKRVKSLRVHLGFQLWAEGEIREG